MTNGGADPLSHQGNEMLHAGRFAEAERLARQRLGFDPNDAAGLALISDALCAQSRFEEAMPWLRKAIATDPRNAQLYCNLAVGYQAQSKFTQALGSYEKALKIKPDYPAAVAGRAEVAIRRGKMDRARTILRPYLRRGDASPRMTVLYALACHGTGEDDTVLEVAEKHLPRDDLGDTDRQWLLFLQGQARDRRDEHDDAFAAFAAANEILRQPYDDSTYGRIVDRVVAVFTRDAIAKLPRATHGSELPVFIVGMPRCGSTLVEQILDAHPNVHGAGETQEFGRLVDRLPAETRSTADFPDIVKTLPADQIERSAAAFLDTLGGYGRRATRVVEKTLGNFWYLGLANLMFPEARVIHVRREPMDVCFSCYMRRLLPHLHPYASDLDRLGRYYRHYDRLMTHWREVLDMPMLEIDYADLVDGLEETSRGIVDFLGLPWDDRCLRYHESKRDVGTMSYDQVRRPIYRSALARYRHYEKHLGPLRDALGDLGPV
ncbi:MAG: tetratricopeptide repeat protein [Planctomycetes bacterium]|nr:tetratricopeptide repeat protein [Planctomycetota bacterium]